MALLDKPIEVAFVADDSQIQDVMARVGKTSESMGRSVGKGSEAARLGLWSMGEAAENAAQSFGVPHQMARQLGNSVEGLSRSMGGLATAFGLAGLAAMAAYAIWQQVSEQKKRQHEELEKNISALIREEQAMFGNKIETTELKEANERLFEVKQRILDRDFPKWVKEETEAIKKLREEANSSTGVLRGLWEALISPFTGTGSQKAFSRSVEEQNKLRDEADQKEAEIRKRKAERAAAEINELAQLNEAEKKRYYDYDAVMTEVSRRDQEESIKRIMQAQHEQRMKQQAYQVIAQNFASSFQMMASIGGKHARNWFTMYKLSAMAEAVISTHAGAARALKDYPAPISYAVAAAITLAGMAKVAAIRAQTFQGGGASVGGGAVGTFPANPATGLPESGGGATIIVNINGQMAGTYDLTRGVVEELYRNNGSVGGFSVQVERSA